MAVLELKTPGVFVEKIPKEPESVDQVETGIPAFIGYTEIHLDDEGNVIPPTRVTSFLDFEQKFGGPDKRVKIQVDGAGIEVVSGSVAPFGLVHVLYYSVKMFFENGGGPCYIVTAGTFPVFGAPTQVNNADLILALTKLENEDEPTLIVIPESINLGSAVESGELFKAALTQCAKLQDRFTIIDTYPAATLNDEINTFRDNIGTDNLKYGAAYYPRLQTTLPFQIDAENNDSIIVTNLVTATEDTLTNHLVTGAELAGDLTIEEEIKITIASELSGLTVELPPSGAISGVYATVDRTRGVWKAPANVSLNSVSSPLVKLTNSEQANLNVTTTGKSVNAIRGFTGKGIMVWGARTLAGNDNEWRYVPVRRLFIFAEESIQKATEFVVFDSNDANTWLRVRLLVENFLIALWKQGALAGGTPGEAFFVNVGLGETMTSSDVLEGRLIIEIGMAAVRPAEFIILRFSHKLQES